MLLSEPEYARGGCMRLTCVSVVHMTKMIQVRNVPDELHRLLKVRAAQQGTSLSEYLLREILEHAARPTLEEALRAISREAPVSDGPDGAELIREMRDGR